MWDNGEKMAKRAKREKMRAKRENSPSFSLIILQQAFQSTQVGENKRFTQQNVEISVFAYVFLVWTFFFLPLRLVYHICGLSFIFLNHIHWNSLTWILFTFFAFFTTILPQFGFVWSKPRWPVFFPSSGFFSLLQSNLAFFTHLSQFSHSFSKTTPIWYFLFLLPTAAHTCVLFVWKLLK